MDNVSKALTTLMRCVAEIDRETYNIFFAINTELDRVGLYVSRRDNGMEVIRCMGFRFTDQDMAALVRKVREIGAEWKQETLPLGGVERR